MSLSRPSPITCRRLAAAAMLAALGAGVFVSRAAAPGPTTQVQTRQRAATPPGLVYVPAGAFWMGSDEPDADDDARPRRRVNIGSFYIGRTEVTNAEFHRFRPSYD